MLTTRVHAAGSTSTGTSTAVTDPTGNSKNGLEALDGTSFAKLPLEAQTSSPSSASHHSDHTAAAPFHTPSPDHPPMTTIAKLTGHSTAVMDPSGNSKNGLEGVSGEGVVRLPEERELEGGAGMQGKDSSGSASYLNPNLVLAPDPSSTLPPSSATTTTNAASTHVPAPAVEGKQAYPQQPYEGHHDVRTHDVAGGGADTDASIRSLAPSSIAGSNPTATATPFTSTSTNKDPASHSKTEERDPHRGVFGENKPLHESFRKGGDAHVETLRAHDEAKREEARRDEVVVKPASGKEKEGRENRQGKRNREE
ncbi:hypothetical protein NMY22_g19878 [Coprinellus aureogranulatus]|nr:hypothetical protein NMY22_g19878 [Coprinellus aureogranulatus]